MQANTLSYVIDRIENVYGRMTARIRGRLVTDLNNWMCRACRRWNFWFLDVTPGNFIPAQFPIQDLSTIQLPAQTGNFWVDRGWLVTQPGEFSYPFAVPEISPKMFASGQQPYGLRWTLAEAGRVFSVKVFNQTGTQKRYVEILPPEEYLGKMRYDTKGEPQQCTYSTEGGLSALQLNPCPDKQYLLSVYWRLAEPEIITRPDQTNIFLSYYPETVVTAGLVLASRYFGEQKELQMYLMELFGAEYAQKRGSEQTPGGLIGDMISDTRKRMQPRSKSLKVYTSARRAQTKERPLGLRYDVRWWGWL